MLTKIKLAIGIYQYTPTVIRKPITRDLKWPVSPQMWNIKPTPLGDLFGGE